MIARYPRMAAVRQNFPRRELIDIATTTSQELKPALIGIKPGQTIALAVGSRGIANLREIVSAVLQECKGVGAKPFIIPAMGSHGGATPEGQIGMLAEYGVTPKTMDVPFEGAMETRVIGQTPEGVEVLFSEAALKADHVIPLNRVKPHTDFASDTLGSGVLKIMVVGLGKRAGAANYHISATKFGYEPMIRAMAKVILSKVPVLCGIGIVEDQHHQTAHVRVLKREEMESAEAELFREAKRLMPRLPFQDIDLLIIDQIGKNISGSGMDPNIIGRWVHGYSSMLTSQAEGGPTIRRLFVRGLTPETHGNAIGIGLADLTTGRLVQGMDKHVTYINALTSLTPNCAKIPIHFEKDTEAIDAALASVGVTDPGRAKVLRIKDTLSLSTLEVSEAFIEEMKGRIDLDMIRPPREMGFDNEGNLLALGP